MMGFTMLSLEYNKVTKFSLFYNNIRSIYIACTCEMKTKINDS